MDWWENSALWLSLIALGIGGLSLSWQIKSKKYDKKQDYKEDYKEEIESLFDHFRRFLLKPAYAPWELPALFERNSRVSRKILQHLYTCSETKSLYDLLKKMSDSMKEQEKKGITKDNFDIDSFVNDFRNKFYPIWHELQTSPNPDFGSCDKCKDLDLDYVKKHKKFLEESDNALWNLFD